MDTIRISEIWAEEIFRARESFPKVRLFWRARLVLNKRLTALVGRATLGGPKAGTVDISTQAFCVDSVPEDELRDTIRHELAHLMAYELEGDRGHGAAWKARAKQLGARPNRFAPAGMFAHLKRKERRSRHVYACFTCGHAYYLTGQRKRQCEEEEGNALACSCGGMHYPTGEHLTLSEACRRITAEQG